MNTPNTRTLGGNKLSRRSGALQQNMYVCSKMDLSVSRKLNSRGKEPDPGMRNEFGYEKKRYSDT